MGGLAESDLRGACDGQIRHPDEAALCKLVKRPCELCNANAHVYCAADEAQLCFLCDYKVHSANFLVSKHSRDVLCSSCGAPTLLAHTGPWIECQKARHCTLCLQNTGQHRGDNDDGVAASAAIPLSSLESCNSSCCTEDDEAPIWQAAALHDHKRRALILLEEGCGDSEDQCHSPPPEANKPSRKRTAAFSRDRSLERRKAIQPSSPYPRL